MEGCRIKKDLEFMILEIFMSFLIHHTIQMIVFLFKAIVDLYCDRDLVITVYVDVLQSNIILFQPKLPAKKQFAINHIMMGKVEWGFVLFCTSTVLFLSPPKCFLFYQKVF